VTPEVAFLGLLLGTVGLLVLAAITGRRRRIALHLCFVTLSLASLAAAIAAALRVGERWDLASAGVITPIHLNLARLATFSYLWPLVTGVLVLMGRLRPRWHHIGAWLAFGLTVAATITGAWMLATATRLP
jgi:hypothetical protein